MALRARSRRATRRPVLTHLDARGRARMVDVTEKPVTSRRAVAEGVVRMSRAAAALVRRRGLPKGDVLATARLAAIAGAKKAWEWIPLCHPLRLDAVDASVEAGVDRVRIRVETRARERTGVEMEALVAVAAAALAVYDMVKAVDRSAVLGPIRLLEKEGGRSGRWRRAGR